MEVLRNGRIVRRGYFLLSTLTCECIDSEAGIDSFASLEVTTSQVTKMVVDGSDRSPKRIDAGDGEMWKFWRRSVTSWMTGVMDRDLAQLGCRRRRWCVGAFWQSSSALEMKVSVQNSLQEWKKPNCEEVVLW